VGVDTGGTFTDVVAVDDATGTLVATKVPSTPADPAEGFLAGVDAVLGLLSGPAADDRAGAGAGAGAGAAADGAALGAVVHGTTVATNALLEGRLAGLGLVTTDGYRHILEIARQSVPDGYGNSYFWVKPDRIVPADRVRTVGGRIAADGREVRPFDAADAVAAARFFRDRGIVTVGVCLLHSYADPSHEERMRDVLAAEHPEATVSISSEVLPEYREYERSVTTLVDAAVKPVVGRYVREIGRRLDAFATAGGSRSVPFSVMTSNGGVLSAAEVVGRPITTVLSGPAAGALGAALVAREAGIDHVLTCDGGGTSTDVSLVVGGEPTLTTEGTVGAYPCRVPMIDLVTVGAGGGSVAWVSPEGTLRVGPRSAGAVPGPVCYARGGTEPTVTDAHLVLGRIPPHLLGGRIPLDAGAARTALARLAGELGLGLESCAEGVLEVSAWNQANALRRISVARGRDVRDFTAVTFGGSGSLLACRLVDLLGLRAALVPANPGNLSAFGLLTVDVRNDTVRTHVRREEQLDHAAVQGVLAELTGQADAALARQGFPPERRRFVRTADLRYFGQAYEVRVDLPDGPVDAAAVTATAERFHAAHRTLYGYDFARDASQQVEWVNLRVTGIGPVRRPDLPRAAAGTGSRAALLGERAVHVGGWLTARVYERSRLGAGDVVEGPAVVQEFGSTVPVHPGFAAEVDRFGNLLLSRTAPSAEAAR
jgi:N-methylhydantoinase A